MPKPLTHEERLEQISNLILEREICAEVFKNKSYYGIDTSKIIYKLQLIDTRLKDLAIPPIIAKYESYDSR
jgi:hypothetical protein